MLPCSEKKNIIIIIYIYIYTCEDDLCDSVHLYSNGHSQENGVGDVCLQPSVFKSHSTRVLFRLKAIASGCLSHRGKKKMKLNNQITVMF